MEQGEPHRGVGWGAGSLSPPTPNSLAGLLILPLEPTCRRRPPPAFSHIHTLFFPDLNEGTLCLKACLTSLPTVQVVQ